MKIKIKVLNKYFMLVEYGHRSPVIEPNCFELAKQACILDATRGKSLPLPHTGYSPNWMFQDDYPDVFDWLAGLSYQNPPSKVSFRSNPQRYRELVEPLDFSKPFDRSVVEAIHAEFTAGGRSKVDISGHDILHGDLLSCD